MKFRGPTDPPGAASRNSWMTDLLATCSRIYEWWYRFGKRKEHFNSRLCKSFQGSNQLKENSNPNVAWRHLSPHGVSAPR